jgi:hypothetical protein
MRQMLDERFCQSGKSVSSVWLTWTRWGYAVETPKQSTRNRFLVLCLSHLSDERQRRIP